MTMNRALGISKFRLNEIRKRQQRKEKRNGEPRNTDDLTPHYKMLSEGVSDSLLQVYLLIY